MARALMILVAILAAVGCREIPDEQIEPGGICPDDATGSERDELQCRCPRSYECEEFVIAICYFEWSTGLYDCDVSVNDGEITREWISAIDVDELIYSCCHQISSTFNPRQQE